MRKLSLAIATGLLALSTSLALAAPHEGNPGGNCNGYDGPNKVDTNDGSIVLPVNTLFCIKAGDTNTGTLVANGTSTLAQYLAANGITSNVSNYVTYGLVTAPPTPVITAPPTLPPTAPPTLAPTGTPVVTASPRITAPPVVTAAPVTTPNATLPSTDTIESHGSSINGLFFVLAVLVSIGAIALRVSKR